MPLFPVLAALAAAGLLWRARTTCWRERWSAEGAVAAGLALLSVGFFWQFWLLPDTTMPRGGGDLASFLYPTYRFAADSLQAGYVPFWNPHLYGGAPFAADLQSGLYYPPNLVAFLLARPFEYGALVTLAALHYPLAGLGAYALARELGLARLPAFASGAAFAFSGFAVAHLGHYNMLAAAAWTPLALALLHRAARRGDLRWAALAGGVLALVLLAGHVQIGLYAALALTAIWLLRLRADGLTSVRIATLPVALGLGAAGAAVLLLPAFELTRLSLRSDVTYAQAAEFAASPLGFVTFVVPRFFGESPADYWGLRWSLHESYGYVGISALALAALAVLTAGRRDLRPLVVALLGLGALLVSLGETTPLHGWLYRLVPGFDKVRAPGRFMLFVDLAAALLIGFGVQRLVGVPTWRERPRVRLLLRGLVLVLAGGALVAAPLFYYAALTSQDKDPAILRRALAASDATNLALLFLALVLLLLWRWRRRAAPWLAPAAVALLWLDLAAASAGFNPTTEDVLRGYRHDEIVAFLRARAEDWRIDSRTGIADVVQPDLALLHGLEDVGGIFNPLQLRAFDRYWEGLGSRSASGYDLLSTRYVIARRDAPLDPKFSRVFEGPAGLAVFENARAVPRAFVAPTARALPEQEIAQQLRDPGFDPRSAVLLDPGASADAAGAGGAVERLDRLGPNALEARLTGVTGGWLVVTNVDYPGWRASVDGRALSIQRAYGLLQAVALPAGATVVRFDFEPRFWRVGLAVTVLAWLFVAAAGLSLWRARGGKAWR
jgi:hypothetical protein